MKRGSKPTFSNTPLKRWLLKVGPVRRKVLLTKFRADLVRLGLSKLAWREGLLQLASSSFVQLKATTQMSEINKHKGPRSNCEEAKTQRDDNNNNDFMKHKFSHLSSSSSNRKHSKTERRDISKTEANEILKCGTSGVAADNLEKITQTESSERRHSSGSRKRSRSHKRSRKKIKHRIAKEGESRNDITWHLIPNEMEQPLKSTGQRALQLKEGEKMKKKDKMKKKQRIYVKLLEIFGKDIEPSDSDDSLTNTKTHDASKEPIPKETVTSDERMKTQKAVNPLYRKSPTFSDRGRKKRRDNHAAGSGKKLKTVDDNNRRDSVTSDNTSTGTGGDTLVYQEEIHTPQHDTPIINSTASAVPVVGYQTAVNSHDVAFQELDTGSHIQDSSTNETADAKKGEDYCLGDNSKSEKRTGADTPDSGLTSENDNHSDTTDASRETLPVIRHESVIVKFDKDRDEPMKISLNVSDSTTRLESVINRQNADFTPRVKTDTTSTSEAAVDHTNSQINNLPETQTSLRNRSLKNELGGQLIPPGPPPKAFEWVHPSSPDKKPLKISPNSCLPDKPENDRNPSSTTDTESSGTPESRISCDSDRLLGALDNIYLALHCRRRVCEQEQMTSKLAIMRNRQEEVLKAKREYESKLTIFREDFRYLFDRLDTWDRVLRFIAQGLENRTPPGTKSFTATEVELVMLEAEVKVQTSISKQEASADPPKPQSVVKVLCTIDLTADDTEDVMRDPCDSSTDPPRSQSHLTMKPKSEPKDAVDGTCGHDFNANEIKLDLPSIDEVKTISSQQFEKIEEKLDSSSMGIDDPCFLCSRTSLVACSQCTKATYCSKICQEIHWQQSHHITCVPLGRVIRYKK